MAKEKVYATYKELVFAKLNELKEIAEQETKDGKGAGKIIVSANGSDFEVKGEHFEELAGQKALKEIVFQAGNKRLGLIKLESENLGDYCLFVVRTASKTEEGVLDLDKDKPYHEDKRKLEKFMQEIDHKYEDVLDKSALKEELGWLGSHSDDFSEDDRWSRRERRTSFSVEFEDEERAENRRRR